MEIRVVATSSRAWQVKNERHALFVANALLAAEIVIRGRFPTVTERRQITFVHGYAAGGDTLIDIHARDYGFLVERHPVSNEEWNRIGDAAGPLRNEAMLDDARGCHMLLAIRRGGDSSRGTSHCIRAARKRLIPIMLLDYP